VQETEGFEPFARDIVIVGGCGRVGLPLGIAFASRGLAVTLYDINQAAIDMVNSGRLPFTEEGAQEPLTAAVNEGRLVATADPASVSTAEHIVVIVGTPVDEHLNPNIALVLRAIERCIDYLHDGQILILRSTVHPGVTAHTEKLLERHNLNVDVAFCPERIAEGRAMTELFDLPQIVAARGDQALQRAEKLFRSLKRDVLLARRRSSPSSSPTPGVTSSSPPPTSSG
jgi:UDP-N-acetyl-D-mannosaminuronic acid dehydrogenase